MYHLILRLYKECNDSLYFIRFLDYVISSRYPRVNFTLSGVKAEPLITGEIVVKNTKKHYNSLEAFYRGVIGKPHTIDEVLFNKICGTDGKSLWSILETVTEDELVNFVDQKYRSFLVYKDLEVRIKPTNDEGYVPKKIIIKWESARFHISKSGIENDPHSDVYIRPMERFEFLTAFEDGTIGENLWFYDPKRAHWIRLL